jgi:hypothetical protein
MLERRERRQSWDAWVATCNPESAAVVTAAVPSVPYDGICDIPDVRKMIVIMTAIIYVMVTAAVIVIIIIIIVVIIVVTVAREVADVTLGGIEAIPHSR